MSELKICRICLRTEAKVFSFEKFHLKSYYEEVMAQAMECDNLPHYFCFECAALLHKFHKFKEKCYCGQKALRELLWMTPITYEAVYKIDRDQRNLTSPLRIMSVTDRVKSFVIQTEESVSIINSNNQKVNSGIFQRTDDENSHEQYAILTQINERSETVDKLSDLVSPTPVFVNVKKEGIKEEPLVIVNKRRNSKCCSEDDSMKVFTQKRTRFLDAGYWKKACLSEEDAIKQFRAKADEPKYVRAMFKCTDCFKGFSKEDMLTRHLNLRHCKSLGSFECRFCKTRYKWDSHLRLHMSAHFTRYQCQRCSFVCSLKNSARLHEEYHNGITRKCIECGEEFRHASSFYSHMRSSHRSVHVCVLCGASFVSDAGLTHHRKVKHVGEEVESPSDDDDVATFCDRCDIHFDTRKAYREHLFHSVMHTEGVEDKTLDEITIPKKVLSKKLREKANKRSRSRADDDLQFDAKEKKRRKKDKLRGKKKPTTCHQCGLHFDSQSACMKHHVTEHPGTSFYAPAERHICEICGASLAPGSVSIHKNMHTREKLYACDSCGRQFHSVVALKRHLVTHTGEKPFQCELCEKRFTQSNSMKLHIRTFHLKEPYPKRNRVKKKPEPADAVSSEESDASGSESAPSPEMSALPEPQPEIEPVVDAVAPEPNNDEPVQYLTLD